MKRTALLLTVLFWAMCGYSPALGQGYGEPLDRPEQLAITESFQYALENNKSNEAATWVNPDSGLSGSTIPVKTYQNAEGQYCREFIQTINIGGEEQQGYGTACRQPDGSWQTVRVSDNPSATYQTVEKNTYVYGYPYGYPRGYYYPYYYGYYPWGYYYPYNVFLSFGYFHYGGHHHFRGHHFDGGHHFRGTHHFHGKPHFDGHRHFRGGHGGSDGRWQRGGHGRR